ncbi:uncharacterized protein DUF3892 [Natranaerovirga pectinivora]|uniref:Uncharacterized protein DUF3892 n=1 Tax=Natranaerovirga pectinivora TaxID=682400 RepID=A0A4R3MF00_9FIRM|nr:DUF3892 domain-containing protein [Natranaerovirga pectinivora]TCT11633.1 uncharacterized protein DUF3892 [Natranaerovirga pectinivora]
MDGKLKVQKVRKNSDGDITQVLLDDGQVYTVEEAITLVAENKINGVNVSKSKSGKMFLRSNADADTSNNLDQLPIF